MKGSRTTPCHSCFFPRMSSGTFAGHLVRVRARARARVRVRVKVRVS